MLIETRFKSNDAGAPATLCYTHIKLSRRGSGYWRFVDGGTGNPIGEQYPNKAELLADLARFAECNGFMGSEGYVSSEARERFAA